MTIPHNKTFVSRGVVKRIRSLFFRKVEMTDILNDVGLKESVIRRIVRERNWYVARERYLKYLCSLSNTRNIPFTKMAKLTGTKLHILTRIHRKYKTKKPLKIAWNKRVDNKMEKTFIDEYVNGGKTSRFIAEKFGFKTNKTVLDVLVKNNTNRRPPKIQTYYNESFFEKIDSREKAYILGLIMTDGYIIKDYEGFGIQLTEEDGYILDKIGKIIGSTIGKKKINCDSKRKTMPNAKDMFRLTVTNKKISEDLKLLGVTKRKSKTLRYMGQVPKKNLSHFFRGLFDGDGTVGTAKNKNIWCQLVSASKKFLDDLKLSLEKMPFEFSIGKCTTTRFGRSFDIYIFRICGGNNETIKFLKWMYNNQGDLYLRRKYEKVQNYIS